MPFGIDDPHVGKSTGKTNRLDLPELIVDLYNAAKSANAVSGSKKPISAPLVATNTDLLNDERYIDIRYCLVLYYKVAQRCLQLAFALG